MQHLPLIVVLTMTLIAPSPSRGANVPLIFVSIPPQKNFVEQVAGPLVRVEVLLPPGASPATYEPTPRQMASLKHAGLYLSIGVPFERRLLLKVAELIPELQIIDCRRGAKLAPMEGHRNGKGNGASLDPHIWLDPMQVKIIAGTIADGIGGLLPGAKSELNRNLGAFQEALDRVDAQVGERLAAFSGRELVVFHPAYGYFTRRYGLRQLAVEVEGKAPSARQLAELARVVRDSGQTTIFAQPQFSGAAANTIAEALGLAVVELDPLAEKYLENLLTMSERISAAL
ncbi:MAG: metal ABC transporter solute-binding protein, Zn/Mn family [Thermoanaerobaculales bacterium]